MGNGRRWLSAKVQRERNALIMRLRYEEGLTYEQIAPQVRLSPRGVKGIALEGRKAKYENKEN